MPHTSPRLPGWKRQPRGRCLVHSNPARVWSDRCSGGFGQAGVTHSSWCKPKSPPWLASLLGELGDLLLTESRWSCHRPGSSHGLVLVV